jgi:hypothetical protein
MCMRLVLGFVLATVCATAAADMRVTASLSDFSVQVYDLRPGDASGPSFTLDGWHTQISSRIETRTSDERDEAVNWGGAQQTATEVQSGGLSAHTAAHGALEMTAFAQGNSTELLPPVRTREVVYGAAQGQLSFTLGAYSSATLSLLGRIDVERDGIELAPILAVGHILIASPRSVPGEGGFMELLYGTDEAARSEEQNFAFDFVNNTGASAQFVLYSYMSANVYGISPVPEIPPWTAWLAGLAMVGWLSRRVSPAAA